MVLSVSLRRVFIYLLRPRWHRKSLRFAASFPMPTTPEQTDFAHGKSFILCIFQPTKSACSAATVNRLSGVEQPLFSVSGRKRYNTLDFAGKVVCQQGCSRPYWMTQSQRSFSFGILSCPYSGYPSCFYTMDAALPKQEKPAQRFALIVGGFLCRFLSATAGQRENGAIANS